MYVRRVYMCMYICLHTCTPNFHVCVCVSTYVHTETNVCGYILCTCMHAEIVCVYVYMFVLGVYMCAYLPQNPRRPLSSCEGEENRSCLYQMVTECWLGLFLMSSDGGSTLWEVAGVWMEILHVGALIYTYANRVCMCVCICLHIWTGVCPVCECLFACMYTDNTCVCLHVYVYAHRECMCVYACLHIFYVRVYISTYSHRVFMCDL